MALEFASTDKPIEEIGFKVVVYGPAGVGKTMLIPTMPGGPGETVMIGAEEGELSLQPANQIRVFGVNKTIRIIKIKTAADLKDAYELIIGPHGKGFKNVALDSLSEIAERILAEQMALCKDPRKAYGNMQDIVSKYIRLFRDLRGKNVLMTAKMERSEDAEGVVSYMPAMPGKTMTRDLPHYFDEVFRLHLLPQKDPLGRPYRAFQTNLSITHYAKDRSGALAEIEEPNLAKVIAKIKQT